MRRSVLKPYLNGYKPPTGAEVQEALTWAGITKHRAAQLLGVSHTTIGRWIAEERGVPYAPWRLLLIETGRITPSPD